MWVTTAQNQEKALPENLKKEHKYSGIKQNGAMGSPVLEGTPQNINIKRVNEANWSSSGDKAKEQAGSETVLFP